MKKGKSKNKGGSYERLICKQLSLWASKNERVFIKNTNILVLFKICIYDNKI